VSRSDEELLSDLLATAEKLNQLVSRGEANFASNFETQWAIERAVLNIGEYCTHLSDSFKEKHPDVPWKDIVGMRTVLAHSYHRIDETAVWNAASVSVPALVKALKK
jgi:uncharacterized protein with HEPN domain